MIITVQFLTDWHCSSGLTGGPEVNSTVAKDKNRFPYIPGRTLKGLLRDNAHMIATLTGNTEWETFMQNVFGTATDKNSDEGVQGKAIFSNATLSQQLSQHLLDNPSQVPLLYRTQAFTRIDDNGIAVDKSLRSMEYVIPLSVSATIEGLTNEESEKMALLAKNIKRLGLGRNRGFGQCRVEVSL